MCENLEAVLVNEAFVPMRTRLPRIQQDPDMRRQPETRVAGVNQDAGEPGPGMSSDDLHASGHWMISPEITFRLRTQTFKNAALKRKKGTTQ